MLKLTKTHDICKVEEPKLTVVLLHGIAADSSSYDGLLEYLEKNPAVDEARFVTYDLLGAGKSYTSDELDYNFKEQLEALETSIDELGSSAPIVIVAHSMGTMIATRFAKTHKKILKGLVLVSPPIYRAEDIKNPMFTTAMDGFREVVGRKTKGLLESKAFNNEIKNIVSNPHNYDFLIQVTHPTILIYGELDRIIAPFNIHGVLKANSNIQAVKTAGSHGVTRDKYAKITSGIKSFLE